MTVQNVRAPGGDIAPLHWQGGSLDCAGCEHARLRELPAGQGCEPGHACMQDRYARRIERFFHWHPDLANEQLAHPYFEVRAIAARHADVFRLPALLRLADDSEAEVRRIVAERLPAPLLSRLAFDPDWRVRWEVARRAAAGIVTALVDDADEEVRALARQRGQSNELTCSTIAGQTLRPAGVDHG